jgi:orotate phosphoribosyltransferase
MLEQVLKLLSARKGHFLFESGHHGDLWLDLESLCLNPAQLKALAAALAKPLAQLKPEIVCGPLVEGAFVALLVALELGVPFVYSERYARTSEDGLYPAGYRIPAALREGLRGKRVAIVNDVINAGSAVKGTFADLEACGAPVAGIATLLVLGTAAADFAQAKNIPLASLATQPGNLWTPSDCPLCAAKVPLQDVADFAASLARKN